MGRLLLLMLLGGGMVAGILLDVDVVVEEGVPIDKLSKYDIPTKDDDVDEVAE